LPYTIREVVGVSRTLLYQVFGLEVVGISRALPYSVTEQAPRRPPAAGSVPTSRPVA